MASSEADILAMYDPPSQCPLGRCQDLLPEFWYYVVVPVVAVTVMVLLLALVVFCHSQSCKCKKYTALSEQTSDIQLENYNSIRRASANLRLMSQNRETPLMGSRDVSSVTLDRAQRRHHRVRDSCSSAPGTLQRQNRGSQVDQSASSSPPRYHVDPGENLGGHQSPVFSTNGESPSLPPPPTYRKRPDDMCLRGDFQESTHSSLRFDDSPASNGRGTRSLFQHSYEGTSNS